MQQQSLLFSIDQEHLQGLKDVKTILLEAIKYDNHPQHQQDFHSQLIKYTNMLQSNQLANTIINILEPHKPLANMKMIREDAIQVLFGMIEYPTKLDQAYKILPKSSLMSEGEMRFRTQLVDYGRDWAEEILLDTLSTPDNLKAPVDDANACNQLSTIQSVAQEFILKSLEGQKGHISTQTLSNICQILAEEIETEDEFLQWTEALIQASTKDLTGLSESFMKRLLEKPAQQHYEIDKVEKEDTSLFDQLEIETKVCLWANFPTLWEEQLKKCLIAVHASPFLHVKELLFGSIEENTQRNGDKKTLQSRFCQSFQEFPHLHVLMVELLSRPPYLEFLTSCRSMELYSTLCTFTSNRLDSLQRFEGLFATPMMSHLMLRFHENPSSQVAYQIFQVFDKSTRKFTPNQKRQAKEWMIALESPLLLFKAFQLAFGSVSGPTHQAPDKLDKEEEDTDLFRQRIQRNAISYIVWFHCFFNSDSRDLFTEMLDQMAENLVSSSSFIVTWLQSNRSSFQQFTIQRIRIIWIWLLSHLKQITSIQATEILSCVEYMLRRFGPPVSDQQTTKRSLQIGIMTQLLYDLEAAILLENRQIQDEQMDILILWIKKVVQIMQLDDQVRLEIHHIQLVLKRLDHLLQKNHHQITQ